MATVRELFGNFLVGWGSLLGGDKPDSEKTRLTALDKSGQYFSGIQPKMIKTKAGKEDDNVTLNYVRKVVDKSAHMLAGAEIEFDFEDGEEDLKEYVDAVWERNRKDIFLLGAAKMAGVYRTGYIKILPDYYGDNMPRLEPLHPIQMQMFTAPEDIDTVTMYRQEYTFSRSGEEVSKRIDTVALYLEMLDEAGNEINETSWEVITYEASKATNGKWQEIDRVPWGYEFPPIIHWQNLPSIENPYGESDIEDILELQDKINYNASKIGRIIRYHAHPKLWGRGFNSKQKGNWGEDEVIVLPGEQGMMDSIEMQSDLASSMAYLNMLSQSLFDITSTVNLSTIKDKLGQLTNFGLQVLYQDALEKLHAKRLTFGEMLTELNRRLLVLRDDSYDGEGGFVVWPADVIPQNQAEEAEMLERDVLNGFVSKQTARGLRGYDHEREIERIEEEKEDLGTTILNALNRGQ